MVIVAGVMVLVAPETSATSANSGPDCIFVHVSLSIYNVRVTYQATNATVSWYENQSSGFATTFYWGNSTNYQYSPIHVSPSQTYANGSASFATPLLDYLEPTTEYDFEIYVHLGSGLCGSGPWEHTGSWTDGADSLLWINGTVVGKNSLPASNMLVHVSCVSQAFNPWYTYGLTDTSGRYAIYVGHFNGVTTVPYCDQEAPLDLGWVVTATNVRDAYGSTSSVWPGHFNVSVVTWDVQVVRFVLPLNYNSSYMPVITDFSNANSTNGMQRYSNINYTTGTTYSTSEKDCSTYFFKFGSGCHSTTTEFNTTHTYDSADGNDFVSQRYHTSGLVIADGFNRTQWLSWVDYFAPYGNPQDPALQPITDWLAPSTYVSHGGYLLGGWGANGLGVLINRFHPQGGSVTTSTTNATTGVKELSVAIDVSYFVGVGVAVADLSWSQTSSETQTSTLSWSLQIPANGTAPKCAVVYGQGGTASLNTADIIGVWVYAPSGSPGSYTCPLPTQ